MRGLKWFDSSVFHHVQQLGAAVALLMGMAASPMALAQQAPARAADESGRRWLAGAASVEITPPANAKAWLAGYAARKEPATGVEQPIYAKALVITQPGGEPLALVTLDLIGIRRPITRRVADRIESRYGIPRKSLVLFSSHTHCGPIPNDSTDKWEIYGIDGNTATPNVEFTTELENKIVEVVGKAMSARRPAKLEHGEGKAGFAVNRREATKDGFKIGVNPAGPTDQSVPVLKVTETGSNKPVAIMFGYACHNTTLGAEQMKFCGDYAGYAQAAIEKAHPGAVALFVNGCSGDQNPYPRRSTELAATHGQTLATAVESALGTTPKPLGARLRAAYREIPLAYGPLPTRAELEARQKGADKLDAAHAGRVLARLDEEGALPQHYPYPVQVVRLGNELTWVLLAGEVVIDYALRFKREIRDPLVWVSAYTNDVPTYIPSRRVWEEGGYEGGDAMKWGHHPTPKWSGEVESRIADTVHELRRGLE